MDMTRKKLLTTRNMVRIASMAVISTVLMFFDISTWFAPPFLKLDISDLPSLIASFAMGPAAGVMVQLLKNILNLVTEGSMTGGVGELSNFIVGSVFIFVSGTIYHKDKTFKNAVKGLILGVIVMTMVASVSNYFIVFPLYSKIMPLDAIIELGSSLNKYVVDYKSLILFAVVPFNLLKGTITSIVTILVYKRIAPVLKDEI